MHPFPKGGARALTLYNLLLIKWAKRTKIGKYEMREKRQEKEKRKFSCILYIFLAN